MDRSPAGDSGRASAKTPILKLTGYLQYKRKDEVERSHMIDLLFLGGRAWSQTTRPGCRSV